MSTVHAHAREAVRVKVKKCELNLPTEWRKFSVDPQITSMEVLYSLLAKAFEIKYDFSIKYKAFDAAGNEIYLPVLSDWDLDAAFLRIHNISIQTDSEPCLILQIDVKPHTEVKEWDATAETMTTAQSVQSTGTATREQISPLQQSIGVSQKYVQHMQTKLPGLIINQMEKTFSIVQKAFNMTEEQEASLPPRAPLSDSEFRLFQDALGQIQRSDDLRKVIFFGGIDSSLRRVVWKHILNVYPSGMNGHQRMTYMRRKSEHYFKLRDTWKTAVKNGCIAGELAYVTSMVKKDVLRTDRLHTFYAGTDDNQNIAALFNILTTYALNHPSVSYCQGMSDIASPLLVTMNDEAQAYICFCAIMSRMRGNFMLDGISMTQKFAHLTEALSYYDPDFWEYLKSQQADDLLFCYRWLLLELKREFPFEDALRMLEVQWSSLKYDNSGDHELSLFEKEFVAISDNSAANSRSSSLSSLASAGTPNSPYLLSKPRENPYTKVCALRRQSSSASLSSLGSINNRINTNKLDPLHRLNHSLDENVTNHAMRRQRRVTGKAHQSLDESKMLQLIEGMEQMQIRPTENKLENVEIEDDDEVFLSSTPSSTDTNNHFDFLPTNPFKEDAQLTAKLESQKKKQEKLQQALPQSIAKLQSKNILSNYNAVSNIIVKQLANASNASMESVKKVGSTSGGHFKELKEKIAASRKVHNFEEILLNNNNNNYNSSNKSNQKLVKNFNEFLNFGSTISKSISDNMNESADQITTTTSLNNMKTLNTAITPTHPLVQLLTNSFDESDSSSVPDTSWSGSTAATAIQQCNNSYLSNNSLQLELNSSLNSTATHTPERTPGSDGRAQSRQQCNAEDSQNVEQDYYQMSTNVTHELRIETDLLEKQLFGVKQGIKMFTSNSCEFEYEKLGKGSLELINEHDINKSPEINDLLTRRQRSQQAKTEFEHSKTTIGSLNPFVNDTLLIDEDDETPLDAFMPPSNSTGSLPEVLVPISTADGSARAAPDELATNATEDVAATTTTKMAMTPTVTTTKTDTTSVSSNILPSPAEFGGGNPFLIFLCLTLLLQHRNTIMKAGMDYNEIAMHFDKMVRKHDVTRVLNQSRRMYIDYLKTQNAYRKQQQKQQKSL